MADISVEEMVLHDAYKKIFNDNPDAKDITDAAFQSAGHLLLVILNEVRDLRLEVEGLRSEFAKELTWPCPTWVQSPC